MTTTKGSTALINLKELFTGRRFVVPDYQRGYSWELPQLIDLRKDIENLYQGAPEQKHYTGTIVASSRTDDGEELDVVDGQQRLTTLVILLKAIHDLDPAQYSTLWDHYIQRGAVGNKVPVLKPNAETAVYFNDRIIEGNEATECMVKSHDNLDHAARFFKEWLDEVPDHVAEITEIVTCRFGFIFFMPKHDKEIGIMFEVINNRGKALSQLEMMKNYFIYYATVKERKGLHDRINIRWRELLRSLSLANITSNADEGRFIRYCYLVFFEINKERSWDVYGQMKERFPVAEQDAAMLDAAVVRIQDFVDLLQRAAGYLRYLYRDQEYAKGNPVNDTHTSIDRILRTLRCHPVDASIMPLYLAIMDRTEAPADKLRLLRTLEVLNFRLYVLPRVLPRADSKQGTLFELAHAYFHRTGDELYNEEAIGILSGNRPQGSAAERLDAYMKRVVQLFCPETKFVEALTLDRDEAENYYRWNGLRFFLASYEEHLNREKGITYDIQEILKDRNSFGTLPNDHLSVEHVWAQNNLATNYPVDHREKRRLGNLVLLGMSNNISLSDNAIPQKVAAIQDRNSRNSGAMKLMQVSKLVDLLHEATVHVEEVLLRRNKGAGYYHDLARRLNDVRETELIRFAMQRWKLEGEVMDRFEVVDSLVPRDQNQIFVLKPVVEVQSEVPETNVT